MMNEEAERIRKLYKYRRMILNGKIVLPYREAALLIGPDCAYHLYSIPDNNDKGNRGPAKKE